MKKLVLLLMAVPALLGAQTYNLDDLIKTGLAQNPTVQQAQNALKSARSQIVTSKWNLAPTASVSLSWQNSFVDLPQNGNNPASGASFSLSKDLSLNDSNVLNYRYAKVDYQTSALELQQTTRQVAYQILEAYAQVLSAQTQKGWQEQNLVVQQRLLEEAQALNQLGKNTSYEITQARVNLLNARISLLESENTIRTKRRELFVLVGIPDAGYNLGEVPDNTAALVPELGFDGNEALEILDSGLERNRLTLNQKQLDYLPTTTLKYAYNRSVEGEDFDFDQYDTSHTIMLSFSYDLFNLFKTGEERLRTELDRNNLLLQKQDKKDNITADYAQDVQDLNQLQQLNDLYTQKLQETTLAFSIAEEQYRLGRVSQIDMDKARSELLNAQTNLAANKYDLFTKKEAVNLLLSHKLLGEY